MTTPRNAPGLLARAKDFNSLYKQHPNAICTALIVVGLLPYLVNPTFLFGLGSLIQLVGYGVLLFAAVSRNLITGEKTKQQRRMFYLIAGALILFIPMPLPALILLLFLIKPASRVIRGQEVVSANEMQRLLNKRQEKVAMPQLPLLEIGGVQLTNDLENLGVFCIGSPGSGKTQAIKKLLETLREREDFRVMVLDRNGELMESFYNEETDKLFNPKDARSVSWSHLSEGQQPETMAAAMVPLPQNEDRAFFAQAARSLLSDLYERCDSNSQIWEVISRYSHDELKAFVSGGLSTRIFDGERMTASVLATMVNYMRFYRDMDDGKQPFSFSQWAKHDNPEWLFLPIFEDDAEKYKPMVSAAFEMALRGMLSNENRWMKTAIVIDELGALNKLGSLNRLTAESRKFGGTLILGTQTDAQIDKVYGEYDTRIILQGTATKLILNCRDEKTAERFAKTIGKQERIDWMKGTHKGWVLPHGSSRTENLRETHLVLPSELQALPKLEGYLTIANGTPPAKVKIEPKGYLKRAERFVSKDTSVALPANEVSIDTEGS